MIDKRVYWVWLQRVLGYANNKILNIIELYNDIEKLYNAGEKEWRLCGIFTSGNIQKMLDRKNLKKAIEVVRRCDELGYKVLSIIDDEYPAALKNIPDPPVVLYVCGDLTFLKDRLVITVVGTRNATEYGKTCAFKLSYDLTKLGAVVVSGGALGIDSCAHKAALQAGGKTIVVLGCGINYNYLMENANLRKQISKNGAIISEYPPDESAVLWKFPQRNRVMSGISNGVLVVEAGKKSGTMITVKCAIEQNRDVFAVPGNIQSSKSDGTNQLIKEGAKVVTCVDDILEEYAFRIQADYRSDSNKNEHIKDNINKTNDKNTTRVKESKLSEKIEELSENASIVYEVLQKTPKHIDDIAVESKLGISLTLQAITELELMGLIDSLSGKRYAKKFI